jgi:hypothetical protein
MYNIYLASQLLLIRSKLNICMKFTLPSTNYLNINISFEYDALNNLHKVIKLVLGCIK